MATTTGTFTAAGVSTAASVAGAFNVSVSGCLPDAKTRIDLERSFDAGSTWKMVKSYNGNVEAADTEPEASGVTYRLNCREYPGGSIVYRVGN